MRISDWSSDVCSSDLDHLSDERRKGRRTIIASYSGGARERLSGLLRDHGVTSLAPADSWQDALGTASSESGGGTAMVVLPLDHGFASDAISLLTEPYILGERLVRRQKRRKSEIGRAHV